jgi:hypothetical protein
MMGSRLQIGLPDARAFVLVPVLFLCTPAEGFSLTAPVASHSGKQAVPDTIEDPDSWRVGRSLMIVGGANFSLAALLAASSVAMTVSDVVGASQGSDFPVLLILGAAFAVASGIHDILAGAFFIAGSKYMKDAVDDDFEGLRWDLVRAGKILYGLSLLSYVVGGFSLLGGVLASFVTGITLLALGKVLMITSGACFLQFGAVFRKHIYQDTAGSSMQRL